MEKPGEELGGEGVLGQEDLRGAGSPLGHAIDSTRSASSLGLGEDCAQPVADDLLLHLLTGVDG